MNPLAFLLTLALLTVDAAAEQRILSVVTSADQKKVRITVSPSRSADLALMQVFDPATGHAVSTLYAGPAYAVQDVALTKVSGIPAGAYKLRFRQGLDLVLDKSIEPSPELQRTFSNPTDVVVLNESVYVLDAGVAGHYDPAEVPPMREWRTTKNATHVGRFYLYQAGYLTTFSREGKQSRILASDLTPEDLKIATECAATKKKYAETHPAAIYRFTRDGRADRAFGDRGRILSPVNASHLRSLGVDDQGLIYLSSGWHNLIVLTADGGGVKTLHTVGGWDGVPHGPKCTPWVRSLALGGNNRVYIPNEYGHMKAYDRTKGGFAGIISSIDIPKTTGLDRATAADPQGRVYHIGKDHRLGKYVDDGAALKLECTTDKADKLNYPTGPSASGGLVWVACHGPSFGPFWDSGGGGEIVLYWDDQEAKKLRLVARDGAPGTSDAPMEFLNPSSSVMSREHTDLWVTEDALHNHEGPPGNARVRRYIINAARTEEVDITLPVWP